MSLNIFVLITNLQFSLRIVTLPGPGSQPRYLDLLAHCCLRCRLIFNVQAVPAGQARSKLSRWP